MKSTFSCGHSPVWYHLPRKDSSPGKCGTCAAERQPTAVMKNRADVTAPSSVRISHRPFSSSQAAEVTRVLNWMSRRRSNRSATCCRYRRISGWAGYRSDHSHSSRSSLEKE